MEISTLKTRSSAEEAVRRERETSGATAPGPTAPAGGEAGEARPAEAAPPARLAFLVYLNRSGSTFLSRRLADYEDVAVSLEAQFDDGLVRAGWHVHDAHDVDALLDRVLADPKFSAWDIDPERLRRRLVDGGFPVPFGRFLRAALAESFEGDPARVHVYKNGRMLERPDAFRTEFPDAKVVFIVRDPRAIHASQRRNRDSQTGRRMSPSPAITARWFVRTVRTLQRFASADWLHVVRFEDLMVDPDGECERVLDFLGASVRRRTTQGAYTERIPEAQRHLHEKVGGDADPERSASWGDELDDHDIALVEQIAGPEMTELGYRPSRPVLDAGRRISVMLARLAGECDWLLGRLRWNVLTRPRL